MKISPPSLHIRMLIRVSRKLAVDGHRDAGAPRRHVRKVERISAGARRFASLRRAPDVFALVTLLLALSTQAGSAALIGRLETTPGSGLFLAYYDTDQDLTWAADSTFVAPMPWAPANAAAAAGSIGGVSGWRLPDVDRNGDGDVLPITDCDANPTACLDNEVAYQVRINGISSTNTGPFALDASTDYWTRTDAGAGLAWEFGLVGAQGIENATAQSNRSWWVRDGDVPLVVPPPVPTLSAPLGMMLIGACLAMARRRLGR